MEDIELEDISSILLALVGVATVLKSMESKRKYKKKRRWVSPFIATRCQEGTPNIVADLKLKDVDEFRRYMRMDVQTFEELLLKVTPAIAKHDTTFRRPISASDRLAVTLRYLATGESRASLHFQYRMGRSTINGIIAEVVTAIHGSLKDTYLKVPSSVTEWETISRDYLNLWNFPNCLGAMDGKHIRLQQPPHSGSTYYNYKQFFSMVLFAIVDANLKFIYIDVGTNGRISDGGVYAKSSFNKQAMDNNLLSMPQSGALPGTQIQASYVFIADDAFPLTTRIMKPYPGQNLDTSQRIHNYRLSRARRTVENAFGILASRFRVFKQDINTTLERCQGITLACCSLHNFLKDKDVTSYIGPGIADHENLTDGILTHGTWRQEAQGFVPMTNTGGRPGISAQSSRDLFKDYFNGPGAVHWQDRMVNLH